MFIAVGAMFHAVIEEPSSGSVEKTEDSIVSRKNSVSSTDKNNPQEESKKKLRAKLSETIKKLKSKNFILRKRNSILCCFICTSEDELHLLKQHYDDGVLRSVLEQIFTILAKDEKSIRIRHLHWDPNEYSNCLQRLRRLKEPTGQLILLLTILFISSLL